MERIDAVQGEVVNVGSGRGHSLLHLAELIVDRANADVAVTVDANRSGEVNRFVADVNRARHLMGFDPSHSLPEGLDETVEWYRDRPNLLDELV
jgi:UDP-glucose 4-epimerase